MEIGVVWKNRHVRNSVDLDIGVVSHWPYAQETLRAMYNLHDFDHPISWNNQIATS